MIRTEAENCARVKLGGECYERARLLLKVGDRVRVTACPGTKRTITFAGWSGQWMISKSGREDYHPINVDMINGHPVDFKTNAIISPPETA